MVLEQIQLILDDENSDFGEAFENDVCVNLNPWLELNWLGEWNADATAVDTMVSQLATRRRKYDSLGCVHTAQARVGFA